MRYKEDVFQLCGSTGIHYSCAAVQLEKGIVLQLCSCTAGETYCIQLVFFGVRRKSAKTLIPVHGPQGPCTGIKVFVDFRRFSSVFVDFLRLSSKTLNPVHGPWGPCTGIKVFVDFRRFSSVFVDFLRVSSMFIENLESCIWPLGATWRPPA